MSEYIISDEALDSIRRTCYEAGMTGRENFTCRSAGEEIVRCRDCEGTIDDGISSKCETFIANGEDPNGFCKWGKRHD